MWNDLPSEDVGRREQILVQDVSGLKVLHALAFARDDRETSAALLGEYLGRDLDELEDPRTESAVLEEHFERVRNDPFGLEWFKLVTNVAIPASVAAEMARLAGPATPLDYFDDQICAELAGNPQVPESLVPLLAALTARAFYGQDDDLEPDKVPYSLCGNPGLSVHALEIACGGVKSRAAENISIPIEWMDEISTGSALAQQALARNIMLTEEVFNRLAKSDERDVIYSLVRNRSAPGQVLMNLCSSPIEEIRIGIAENPGTSPEALVVLSEDSVDLVVARVSRHSNTPTDVLRELASRDSRSVRIHLASNTASPDDILSQLAEDGDPMVRSSVARNHSAQEAVLLRLANDSEVTVRRAVHQNPSADDATRAAATLHDLDLSLTPSSLLLSWQR